MFQYFVCCIGFFVFVFIGNIMEFKEVSFSIYFVLGVIGFSSINGYDSRTEKHLFCWVFWSIHAISVASLVKMSLS